MNKLETIKYFVDIGGYVFPVVPNGKKPATLKGKNGKKMGHHTGTKDLNKIVNYWHKGEEVQGWYGNSDYNIGCNLIHSGWVVLDFDTPESLEKFKTLGDIPKTMTVKSPRGFHYYFKARKGCRYNGRIKNIPGMDIKHNGYTLIPPSNKNGKGYDFFDRSPIVDLPDWIHDLTVKKPLTTHKKIIFISDKQLLNEIAHYVGTAMQGDRHNSLLKWSKLAGGYVESGVITKDEAKESLMRGCSANGLLSEEDVSTTINDGIEYGRKEPIERDELSNVKDLLTHSKTGFARTFENLEIIMRNDEFFVGKIRFDEFKNIYEFCGNMCEEADITKMRIHISKNYGLEYSKDTMFDMLPLIADRFHSIRNYLGSLTPENNDLAETWLIRFCGAEDCVYTREVSKKWLISGIARAMDPGCQVDHIIVLEGIQGIGKTKLLRLISKGWFQEFDGDIKSKDGLLSLQGSWIIEMQELSAFRKQDQQSIKGFLSRAIDKFRAPYDRITKEYKRDFIFVGTTNDSSYLLDITGNRRFWPISIHRDVDENEIAPFIDGIWANALYHYNNGENWWPTDIVLKKDIEAAQDEYTAQDPWISIMLNNLDGINKITTSQILSTILYISPAEQRTSHQIRLANVMKSIGWKKTLVGNKRLSGYKLIIT